MILVSVIRQNLRYGLLVGVLTLAACAPANLDITPTATLTPVPTQTPTPQVTPTPANAESAAGENPEETVNLIVESVPQTIPAGAVQWRVDFTREPETVDNVTNGVAKRVFLNEAQGGQASLTFGVFNSPEDAGNYYEFIRNLRTVLETGQPDENFPQPNLFGQGLYGSNAIFQLDDVFVEVSVEAFSSTAGNPLPPLSRQVLEFVDSALASVGGKTQNVDETTATAGDSSSSGAVSSEALLDSILASIPDVLPGGAVQWRYDRSVEPQQLDDVTNGIARRVRISDPGGATGSLTFGVFETPEDAQTYYEFIRDLRTVLEGGESDDDFPQPNLFGQGLYGSNAIFQLDNIFLEVSVEQFPSTAGNPLPGISREALAVIDAGTASSEDAPDVDAEATNGSLFTVDAVVGLLPETISAGGSEWERGMSSLDSVADGSAMRVVFSGDAQAIVYIGLLETRAAADAYRPGDSSSRTVLPISDQFLVIAVDAGEASAAVPGIMSGVLSAVDAAIENSQ